MIQQQPEESISESWITLSSRDLCDASRAGDAPALTLF
jgi:hypothetical protein